MPKAKDICNQCDLPCERLFLQDNIRLSGDGTAKLVFIVTNTSGRRIRSPIMLVSSLLGHFMFAKDGMQAGETKKIVKSYKINPDNYEERKLINVSFLARGVPTGNIDTYSPQTRLSQIMKQEVLLTDRGIIEVAAQIRDNSILYGILPFTTIDGFSSDLSLIVEPGTSIQIDPLDDTGYFIISGTSLILKPGVKLPVVSEPFWVNILITFNHVCRACPMRYTATSGDKSQSEFFYASYFE